ncbi:MAG: translation elongation factor G [Deltaproteobacteria bacterium GWC2_42_11]|nr:MAG: translation elongation factor G [Deltaproteobacteria bacterium GWC2_42_11]
MEVLMDKKRNVAIIAHSGAGKTTLAEAVLFNAKATDKLGRVDDGSSMLDFEPEEIKRKITLSAKVHHYEWDKYSVNIIDTPGYSNFIPETENCLTVVGGAVVILSAISGVKVQTEEVWRFANEYAVSRIAFVNKMDKEFANFIRAVDDMEKVLNVKGVPVQLPIGSSEDFKGVIDLLQMKALVYKNDLSGNYEIKEIPGELMAEAKSMREHMIEAIAETDDAFTEKYLNGEELTIDEIKTGLKEGALSRRFVPVLCGSAFKNIGVQPLMDMIDLCLPSPLEKGVVRGVIKGKNPVTGEEVERHPSFEEPFSAFVFKTTIDPFTGKLSIFRIYSGKIKSDSSILNSTKNTKEKISHLYLVMGKKLKEVSIAGAGDIVAVSKFKETSTGDTLCDEGHPVVFPGIPAVNAVLSYAIAPKTKSDEDKLHPAIIRLMDEDTTLKFTRGDETKEFILSGVGQTHLEIAVERLRRKYGVDVVLQTPKVPYKETVRSSVKVQGRYKKQSGGRGQYGDAWIELSPLPRGKGFEFADNIVGGVIPRQYIPAVEKGIVEAMHAGVVAGYPVVDVRASLYDGSYHSVDSSEMAFKIAGSMAFKKGMEMGHPVLLEPIMSMEITVPDENLGDAIGDLNSRRGKIHGVEPKANSHAIKAAAPMSEMLSYASDLKSMTGDRGMFTMDFSHYEEVPTHLAQKIINAAKAARDAHEKK